MATEAPIFTPDVEELLREIAKEPDSVLLRMPREKVKASLMETRSPVGPMTPGLSNAERELVRVHREEFAFQLRKATWVKLAADGVGPRVVSRQGRGTHRIPVPSLEETREEFTNVSNCFSLAESTECLVPDWMNSPIHEWPSATAIATIAHRFAPNSRDLFYAGADHLLQRSPLTALECFAVALEQRPDPAEQGVIIGNMANCQDQLGKLDASLSEWRFAHHRDQDRLDLIGCWFLVAMRTGQDRDISTCNSLLRDLDHRSVAIKELAEMVVARRQLRFWRSTETLRLALARWSSRLCGGGNTLANSLA